MKRLVLTTSGLAICALAYAAIIGPFYVGDLGGTFADTTFSSDQDGEFSVAQRMAQQYLSPILNTPAKIRSAIKSDYIRVVYYGGQDIADFKIERWPSSIPVTFTSKVPSVNTPRPSASILTDPAFNCVPGVRTITQYYNTGYWGQSATIGDDNSTMTITASWVSTGPIGITSSAFSAIRQYCP